MSSNGRCVTRNNWANITTWAPLSTMEVGGVGGFFFFSTARALSYKTCIFGLLLSLKSLVDVLAKLWFFVRGNCRSGTGALYIGDMTNGRLIRWPIGAKQGAKPKLNFHGWSSYPFNVPPARNEGLIAGLNSPDHKTLFLGGGTRAWGVVDWLAFCQLPGEVILQENKNPQQLCMETFAVGHDGTCYLMDPEKYGSQDWKKNTQMKTEMNKNVDGRSSSGLQQLIV